MAQDSEKIDSAKRSIEELRNMTPGERAEIAFELSDKARKELIENIKKEHPEFTKRHVMNEVLRRCYGEELFREIAAAKGWKD